MRQVLIYVSVLLVSALATPGLAQVEGTRSSTPGDKTIQDSALGIAFVENGRVEKHTSTGYTIAFQGADATMRDATAQILVTTKPFVDLPGSFGGKLYLDTPEAKRLSKDIVKVDSVVVGSLHFRREYWAVYAGMGAWEGVINCTASGNSEYYVLSLHVDLSLGKPGEVQGGGKLDVDGLEKRAVGILSNPESPVIREFQTMVLSFRVVE